MPPGIGSASIRQPGVSAAGRRTEEPCWQLLPQPCIFCLPLVQEVIAFKIPSYEVEKHPEKLFTHWWAALPPLPVPGRPRHQPSRLRMCVSGRPCGLHTDCRRALLRSPSTTNCTAPYFAHQPASRVLPCLSSWQGPGQQGVLAPAALQGARARGAQQPASRCASSRRPAAPAAPATAVRHAAPAAALWRTTPAAALRGPTPTAAFWGAAPTPVWPAATALPYANVNVARLAVFVAFVHFFGVQQHVCNGRVELSQAW